MECTRLSLGGASARAARAADPIFARASGTDLGWAASTGTAVRCGCDAGERFACDSHQPTVRSAGALASRCDTNSQHCASTRARHDIAMVPTTNLSLQKRRKLALPRSDCTRPSTLSNSQVRPSRLVELDQGPTCLEIV